MGSSVQAPVDRPPPRRLVPVAPAAVGPSGFRERAAQLGTDLDVPLQAGPLAVDLPAYAVLLGGEPLGLSPRQVELLALFLAAPRRVWSREALHWLVWGQDWEQTGASRRVDVQLCRLRSRTGLDLFRNVRDRGWALRPLG